MTVHPSVQALVRELRGLEFHAARSGREVLKALLDTAADSDAKTAAELRIEMEEAAELLLTALPAYAPPINVMHRILSRIDAGVETGFSIEEVQQELFAEASSLQEWSSRARAQIARCGAQLISEGSTLLTFTLSETVSQVLREAKRQGKAFSLRVSESRPNRDGLVTARNAGELGIPVGVSIDASLDEVIAGVDLVMVGAEAIQADGSAICKVGTYPLACVARVHGLPLYVIVDTLKFNVISLFGLELPLEGLPREEIRGSRQGVTVQGHLFDITPPHLIAGMVTERGILNSGACAALMQDFPLSNRLQVRLADWVKRRRVRY
jgi:ribose 1,5-bisphosphate isomerase